jgi:D-aminopeptidase
VPTADLTVIVIANLATIDPWRLAHVIAGDALEGDKRLKPRLAPITEAEIKPIAGTWFNAEEPSLFDLAWKGGEAAVTQNGMPFVLGRRPGGWFGSERGSFEFMLKPGPKGAGGTLRVDLGAGRVLSFKKLGKRKAVPAAIAGSYVSPDSGASWDIRRNGESWQGTVSGPLIAGGPAWPVRGVDADTIEIDTPSPWITTSQLAHLVRDRSGRIEAIEVSTGRVKKMRFDRAS